MFLLSYFFIMRLHKQLFLLNVSCGRKVLNLRISLYSIESTLKTWENLVAYTFRDFINRFGIWPFSSFYTWNRWCFSSVQLIILVLESLYVRIIDLYWERTQFIRFLFLFTAIVSCSLAFFKRCKIGLQLKIFWLLDREWCLFSVFIWLIWAISLLEHFSICSCFWVWKFSDLLLEHWVLWFSLYWLLTLDFSFKIRHW